MGVTSMRQPAGGIQSRVAIAEIVRLNALPIMQLIHVLKQVKEDVNRCVHIARVTGFRDGVHVTDRKSDRGSC